MADYKIPSLTADIFIFDDNLNFILIKRRNDPFKNCWALPGGFVEYGESVENAAIREAKEETSIDVELIDLVNVYSEPDRAEDDACDIAIFSAEKLDEIKIAFDHKKIINDCLKIVKKNL